LQPRFFSGVSGSKLADIAAVSGIIMPAVRKTKQDPNEAAGLLACTAVMSETIPPCVNMIIFAFVANISVGGLFMAGLVPAGGAGSLPRWRWRSGSATGSTPPMPFTQRPDPGAAASAAR
jgi:TRAP-type C4-dicarboxylate transport system permease large subunit